jgi:hypothetical protein
MKNLLQNFQPSSSVDSIRYKGVVNNFFRHLVASAINNAMGYPLYKEEVIKFREKNIDPFQKKLDFYYLQVLERSFEFTSENINLILDCFYLCLHPDTITDDIEAVFDGEPRDVEQVRDIILEVKKNGEYKELNILMK